MFLRHFGVTCVIVVLLSTSCSYALNYSWCGPSSGIWESALNWNDGVSGCGLGGTPGPADVVSINGGVNVTVNTNQACAQLDLIGFSTLNLAGSGIVLTVTGPVTGNNATINLGSNTLNAASLLVPSIGTTQVDGGFMNLTGIVNVAASSNLYLGTTTITAAGGTISGQLATWNTAGIHGFSPPPTFNSGSILAYVAAAPQAAGSTLPASVYTLQVANPGGVTLSQNLSASALNLTFGTLTTGLNTVTIPDASVISGDGYVIGNLKRDLNFANTGTRVFRVGTASGETSVSVEITGAGTGTGLTVRSNNGDMPGLPYPANAANRHWSLTADGGVSGFTATLGFSYSDADATGLNESNLKAIRDNGGSHTVFGGSSTNTVANFTTVTGVTAFSNWTVGESTAVPVSLSEFGME